MNLQDKHYYLIEIRDEILLTQYVTNLKNFSKFSSRHDGFIYKTLSQLDYCTHCSFSQFKVVPPTITILGEVSSNHSNLPLNELSILYPEYFL